MTSGFDGYLRGHLFGGPSCFWGLQSIGRSGEKTRVLLMHYSGAASEDRAGLPWRFLGTLDHPGAAAGDQLVELVERYTATRRER